MPTPRNLASELQIRRVNPYDDAEMSQLQTLYVQAERAALPDAAVFTLEDAVALFTRESTSDLVEGYAAFEDGRMVGQGIIIASKTDNLQTAHLFVWVAPQHRSRGVGSTVLGSLVETSRGLGRSVLHASARYPFERRTDHPYRRFAERHGFTLANTEVERRLDLPVSEALLDELAMQAAPYHRGYRLRTVVGPVPAELAQGYCDVINRLSVDAPRGELVAEERRRTPADIADQDEHLVAQARTRLSVVALDANDEVVALTCVAVTPPSYPHVDQWATIVAPEQRGHRLGLAVKVAQTRALQEHFPDKQYVSTTNAETNAHMVAINEALGFRPYSLEGEYQRILEFAST